MGPQLNFQRMQWRMLFALMFCYLFLNLGRYNFAFAMAQMDEALGLTAGDMGLIAGGMLLAYGIGQVLAGNLADKISIRWLIVCGALASCMLNIVSSFALGFITLLLPWLLNGLCQACGFAPTSRAIANWWPGARRTQALSWFLCIGALSSTFAFIICLWVVQHYNWAWLFRIPPLLMLVAVIVFAYFFRDTPQEMGFTDLDSKKAVNDPLNEQHFFTETSKQRLYAVCRYKPFIWATLSLACMSFARHGLLLWVPMHCMVTGWHFEASALWAMVGLPVGMGLGSLLLGRLMSYYPQVRPVYWVVLFMAGAALSAWGSVVFLQHNSVGMWWMLTGFFVYGPYTALFALCPQLLGVARTGTGVGVMNMMAHVAAALSGPVIGYSIDAANQTGLVFTVVALACVMAAGLALLMHWHMARAVARNAALLRQQRIMK